MLNLIRLTLISTSLCTSLVLASYTYTVDTNDDIEEIYLTGNQSLLMTGGKCNTIGAKENSYVRIEDTDHSVQYPFGARAIAKLTAGDNTSVDVFNGMINDVYVSWNATLNVYGGSFHILSLYRDSVAHIRGGKFEDAILFQSRTSTVHIYGYNLSKDGMYTKGNWADGTAFAVIVANTGNLILHEIPEPATMILFGIGGICLLGKRCSRSLKTH